MVETVTYFSKNVKNKNEAWCAYVVLSNGELWLVRCVGSTEKEASDRAVALWEKESSKYAVHNNVVEREDKRGAHAKEAFAGKVWVLNRKTQDRKRVDASELDSYLAKGYVKAGPRSQ